MRGGSGARARGRVGAAPLAGSAHIAQSVDVRVGLHQRSRAVGLAVGTRLMQCRVAIELRRGAEQQRREGVSWAAADEDAKRTRASRVRRHSQAPHGAARSRPASNDGRAADDESCHRRRTARARCGAGPVVARGGAVARQQKVAPTERQATRAARGDGSVAAARAQCTAASASIFFVAASAPSDCAAAGRRRPSQGGGARQASGAGLGAY